MLVILNMEDDMQDLKNEIVSIKETMDVMLEEMKRLIRHYNEHAHDIYIDDSDVEIYAIEDGKNTSPFASNL